MSSSLVNVISWTQPIKSAIYLIAINVCFWFLQRQRPLCVVSIALLLYYLYFTLWKHRLRRKILVDPPDNEEWVNLATYDMEKSFIDFWSSAWSSWVCMRRENYFMWILLTSIFWIVLAKLASHVSFLTILFVISNGGFFAGPILKNTNFVQFSSGDNVTEKTTARDLNDAAKDIEPMSSSSSATLCSTPKPNVMKRHSLGSNVFSSSGTNENVYLSTPETTLSSDDQDISLDHHRLRERSATPGEPESLTPYGADIPDHNDSSEDEFLFDAKHFESSSSSTSNSFELIHF